MWAADLTDGQGLGALLCAVCMQEAKRQDGGAERVEDPVRAKLASYKFVGFISSCFEPYMKIYVEFEAKYGGEQPHV